MLERGRKRGREREGGRGERGREGEGGEGGRGGESKGEKEGEERMMSV